MGLFSSSREVVVGTSVVRAIKDDVLPDSVRSGIAKAIFENGNVSEYVLEELVSGAGVRTDRAYEYAKRSYIHGLPSGEIVEASKGRPELLEVLSKIEGTPVSIEYSFFGRANFLHMGWMYLVDELGYDPTTNKISAYSTTNTPNVFLHDLEVCIPETSASIYDRSALQQWGVSPKAGESPTRPAPGIGHLSAHTPIQLSSTLSAPSWRVRYAWEISEHLGGGEGYLQRVKQDFKEYAIPTTFVDFAKDHFHVKYVVNGVAKYWAYAIGEGTYPTLDALFNVSPKVTGEFFPFLYFRYGKQSEVADKSTDTYRSTKRLSKYFGVDFDLVANSIDENPDIADVEQAMMIMAFPANTKNEVERKYLFTFFENWFYSKNVQQRTPATGELASMQSGDANINVSSIIIQDKRFKMALSCAGIYLRRVVGNIGNVGEYDSGITTTYREYTASYGEAEELRTVALPVKNHFYRRQVSPTLYDEIVVSDLKMLYHVLGNYTVTADDTDDILLIPLDRAICKDYSIIEKEELYTRAMHFVFNSVQIVKIKWYQKSWFSAVIKIVGFIIAVVSFQPQIAQFALAVAAGTTAALTSALWVLIQKLVIGVLVGAAFKLFVNAVGTEFAFLVAVVAAAYGAYKAFEAGSITGAPWASDLLKLSNGLTKAIGETVNEALNGLREVYKEFEVLKDTATKELDTANKLLETNNHLSPFVIFGESPNDFYNRTVHAGNIGINGIQAISSYVDIALTLPKLNDTLGETAYELPN